MSRSETTPTEPHWTALPEGLHRVGWYRYTARYGEPLTLCVVESRESRALSWLKFTLKGHAAAASIVKVPHGGRCAAYHGAADDSEEARKELQAWRDGI